MEKNDNEEIEKTSINDFKFNTNNVEAKIVKSLADNRENFIECPFGCSFVKYEFPSKFKNNTDFFSFYLKPVIYQSRLGQHWYLKLQIIK